MSISGMEYAKSTAHINPVKKPRFFDFNLKNPQLYFHGFTTIWNQFHTIYIVMPCCYFFAAILSG